MFIKDKEFSVNKTKHYLIFVFFRAKTRNFCVAVKTLLDSLFLGDWGPYQVQVRVQ
jgi:hypothetical protein